MATTKEQYIRIWKNYNRQYQTLENAFMYNDDFESLARIKELQKELDCLVEKAADLEFKGE